MLGFSSFSLQVFWGKAELSRRCAKRKGADELTGGKERQISRTQRHPRGEREYAKEEREGLPAGTEPRLLTSPGRRTQGSQLYEELPKQVHSFLFIYLMINLAGSHQLGQRI